MGLSEPTCKCGHETRWHGDLGCGYLGWSYGKPKCGCRLTDSEVVRQIVTAALTEAADAIEARRNEHWQQHLREHPYADGTSCPRDYGQHDAFALSVRIVRDRIPPPP